MKEIPLNHGMFALVDDEDFEELNKHKWFAQKGVNTYYATRRLTPKSSTNKCTQMHRAIMGMIKGIAYDHIDGNGLNNQRSNLRIATKQQNMFNSIHRGGASVYKGVSYKIESKKWRASITYNQKHIHLGYFGTEIEAARVYDAKAKELHGEYARLNFKEESK